MKQALGFMVFALLAGCGAAPTVPAKPYLTEDVLVVSRQDAPKFWAPDFAWVDSVKKRMPDTIFSGCFRFEAIIDSNGAVFDVKPIAASGSRDMPDAEALILKSLRYRPTVENVKHTPYQIHLRSVDFFVRGSARFTGCDDKVLG